MAELAFHCYCSDLISYSEVIVDEMKKQSLLSKITPNKRGYILPIIESRRLDGDAREMTEGLSGYFNSKTMRIETRWIINDFLTPRDNYYWAFQSFGYGMIQRDLEIMLNEWWFSQKGYYEALINLNAQLAPNIPYEDVRREEDKEFDPYYTNGLKDESEFGAGQLLTDDKDAYNLTGREYRKKHSG